MVVTTVAVVSRTIGASGVFKVQGVSRHWTPENLAKSQAPYKIRHLENFQVSSSRLYRAWDLAKICGCPVS